MSLNKSKYICLSKTFSVNQSSSFLAAVFAGVVSPVSIMTDTLAEHHASL